MNSINLAFRRSPFGPRLEFPFVEASGDMTRELRERELRSLMLNDFEAFVRLYQEATKSPDLPPRGSTAEEAIRRILDQELKQLKPNRPNAV